LYKRGCDRYGDHKNAYKTLGGMTEIKFTTWKAQTRREVNIPMCARKSEF